MIPMYSAVIPQTARMLQAVAPLVLEGLQEGFDALRDGAFDQHSADPRCRHDDPRSAQSVFVRPPPGCSANGAGYFVESNDMNPWQAGGASGLAGRLMSGALEAQLRGNPLLRTALEAKFGGQILLDGRSDGKIRVIKQRRRNSMSMPAMPVDGSQALLSKVLNTASGVAGSMLGDFGSQFDSGAGVGSSNPNAQPGLINGSTPARERGHVDEATALLNDPSLTIEDKVTLLIMLIMKKMDEDIEKQANYVNSLQTQQGDRGGKEGQTSVDVESQKMARLVTKRGQMFDTLRQIIDRYNETAKGVIQSMGR